METLKEYKETINVWGKEREVTITIKAEPDPDAISIIESCDEVIREAALQDYENEFLSIDTIFVEVKCNLFSGTDCLGGCFASLTDNNYIKDHLETVDCNHMVVEAIDDYRTNAQKYKDFFEA